MIYLQFFRQNTFLCEPAKEMTFIVVPFRRLRMRYEILERRTGTL